MAIQYGNAFGCEVTAFTTSLDKNVEMEMLGAESVVSSKDLEALKAEKGKFDLVLNTLSVSDDEHFTAFVDLTKILGTYCQLGMPPKKDKVKFWPGDLAFKGINMTGSLQGSRKEMKEMLEFSEKNKIFPICEVFDFKDLPQAYQKLTKGKPAFRCVVRCTK